MTSLAVEYRHSGHFRPYYLKNSDIEQTAHAVRAQLLAADADCLPLSTLREIACLNVNGLHFDLWVSLDYPVTDHETGAQVCGLCEFDPGAGEDAVSLLVSPVGTGMTEELVLSTFGHELGHAVFDAPGWIAEAKAPLDLFDASDRRQQAYRTTTHDAGHLTSSGISPPQEEELARIVEAERNKEKRIAEYRANEFMGSLLVPRHRLMAAVVELAPRHDVTLLARPDLLAEDTPSAVTIKADQLQGEADLENLQKAIGKRFGVHGRFIKVRMARYGLLAEGAG
jgi:hypothetical protein